MQNHATQKVALVNSTTNTKKISRLQERTDRAWFSCLLRHPARKRSGRLFQPWSPHTAFLNAANINLSACRPRLGYDSVQRRRLAGAVRPEQTEDLSGVHGEAALDDRHLLGVTLVHAAATAALQAQTLRTSAFELFAEVLHHQNCRLPAHKHSFHHRS